MQKMPSHNHKNETIIRKSTGVVYAVTKLSSKASQRTKSMSDPNRTTVSLGPSGSDEAGTANPGQIADLPTHPAATPSQPRSEEQGQESAGDSGIVEAELAAQILPNAVTTAVSWVTLLEHYDS
jgi:hypothetical protein